MGVYITPTLVLKVPGSTVCGQYLSKLSLFIQQGINTC